jgi:predicted amino acid racemase
VLDEMKEVRETWSPRALDQDGITEMAATYLQDVDDLEDSDTEVVMLRRLPRADAEDSDP